MTEGWLTKWTGIANHINRSVRTAKTYHYRYSMPVHRGPGGSIYGFELEIDEWLIEFSKKRAKEKLKS